MKSRKMKKHPLLSKPNGFRLQRMFQMGKDCYYNKSKEIVRFRNITAKLPYDFNQSNYMTVESRQFFIRNPQFLMHMIANSMNIKCAVIV